MIILTDIDGVCANFVRAFTKKAAAITGIKVDTVLHYDIFDHYPARVREELKAMVEHPGFCYGMPLIDGAAEGILALQQMGDVYAVTSPWKSPTWMAERQDWIMDYLKIPSSHILHTSAKHLVRGDVLIEDRIENLTSWYNSWPQSTPIVFNQTYNESRTSPPGSIRVDSWPQLVSTLRQKMS